MLAKLLTFLDLQLGHSISFVPTVIFGNNFIETGSTDRDPVPGNVHYYVCWATFFLVKWISTMFYFWHITSSWRSERSYPDGQGRRHLLALNRTKVPNLGSVQTRCRFLSGVGNLIPCPFSGAFLAKQCKSPVAMQNQEAFNFGEMPLRCCPPLGLRTRLGYIAAISGCLCLRSCFTDNRYYHSEYIKISDSYSVMRSKPKSLNSAWYYDYIGWQGLEFHTNLKLFRLGENICERCESFLV